MICTFARWTLDLPGEIYNNHPIKCASVAQMSWAHCTIQTELPFRIKSHEIRPATPKKSEMNETSRKTFYGQVFLCVILVLQGFQCFRFSSCPISNKFVVSLTWTYFTFELRNNVSVEENTPLGKVIFQVRATDADYGNNSIITYSLVPSEYAAKFSIDASTGNITVVGNLDRENTREINLRINASDGTFTVTSELFVIITDVNDNEPIFTSRWGRIRDSIQGVPEVRSSNLMHYNFWSKLYFYMKLLQDVYFSIEYMYSEFQ